MYYSVALSNGHNIQLAPKQFCSILYQKKSSGHCALKEPKDFSCSQSSIMLYSRGNQSVTKAINFLPSQDVDSIQKLWNGFNTKQLNSILNRFSSFLCHPIVRNCFVLFAPNTEFDAKKLMSMAKVFKIYLSLLQEEMSVLNTCRTCSILMNWSLKRFPFCPDS